MTGVVETLVMLSVALFATVVALTHDPLRQVIALAPFSISIILLFTVLQAPDVVLSAIVVGMLAWPVMVLLAIGTLRRTERDS